MRIESFVDDHQGFSSLLLGAELRNILAQLTRDDMLLFKDKINFKLPGGNGFGAHLDAPAYDHIGQIEHTTANLAVDAATVANGCVEVVPRSHKMDVELSHGGSISKAWEDSHEWLPVELASGDLLIFGSHLAHRSGPNATSQSRTSVYATYHNASDGDNLRSSYYADRRENFPPDHGMLLHAFGVDGTNVFRQSVSQVRTTMLVSRDMRLLLPSPRSSKPKLSREALSALIRYDGWCSPLLIDCYSFLYIAHVSGQLLVYFDVSLLH